MYKVTATKVCDATDLHGQSHSSILSIKTLRNRLGQPDTVIRIQKVLNGKEKIITNSSYEPGKAMIKWIACSDLGLKPFHTSSGNSVWQKVCSTGAIEMHGHEWVIRLEWRLLQPDWEHLSSSLKVTDKWPLLHHSSAQLVITIYS